jgi:8-oxo-dGTP pyrophosphatase MutT (NUDIX family)
MNQQRTIQADGHLHGVIVGCQRDDGRWLLIRRSLSVAAPGKVCFPGGGIDGEESQSETVIREMKEEVTADVIPKSNVWKMVSRERSLTLWGWHAELVSSDVKANPSEVSEILWLTESQILNHPDLMPHTGEFLDCLLSNL